MVDKVQIKFLFWPRNCIFLKSKLKVWNRDVVGHLDAEFTTLVDKIKHLDDKEQHQSLTFIKGSKSRKSFLRCVLGLTFSVIKKQKNVWIQERDRHTKFLTRWIIAEEHAMPFITSR